MRRKSGYRALVLSAAVAALGLGSFARAQNVIVNDDFNDGDLTTNTGTGAVGTGWTPSTNGWPNGIETGGAFRADTSTMGGFALQSIDSKDGFDFWNSGGATIQFTTGGVSVNTNQDGNNTQFKGGQTSDWRQELGIVSGYRSNTDNIDDELYHNSSGGLYLDLFYDRGSAPGNSATNLKVTGNLRAVNKDHPQNDDTEGEVGSETIATFTFNGYDGQSDLLSTLHVNNTGFSLSFDKDVSWSVSDLVSGVTGNDGTDTLSGDYSGLFDAPFTDEFVNPIGPDAFVHAMGQNVAGGQGAGNLSNVHVDAAQLAETPPAPDSFWASTTGTWNTSSNWSTGLPTRISNGVLDNNGTINASQSGLAVKYLDIGSDRGLGAPSDDGTGRGGTVNIMPGADIVVESGIRVGQSHNSTGTLNMTGGNVTVHASDVADVFIGDYGNGTMTMSGGTMNVENEFALGHSAGSSGTLTMTGGTITTNTLNGPIGNFLCGWATADPNLGFGPANATLNISGSATINTHFFFSSLAGTGTPGAGPTSTITMTGGTINASGAVVLGAGQNSTSTVTQSGGSINIPSGNGDFVVGDSGTCVYNISGTASVNALNHFIVSTFDSGNGTVNQTGGTITASIFRIGAETLGHFNQSDGTTHATQSIFLGDFDGSHGVYGISGGTLQVDGNLNIGAALASNAAPDNVRIEPTGPNDPQGQALNASGTFTVSGSAATINIGGKFLADPADKSDFRGGPGDADQTRANHANLNFEIFDDSGTSLVNVGGAADVDGAVVNVDLMNGFTPAAGKVFKLVTAASFGATGTGTTQNVGTGVGATQDAGDVGNFSVAVLPDGSKQSLEASAGILPVGALVGPQAAVIGGTVQIQSGSAASKLGNLIVNTGGKLDLTNNKLIVTAPDSTGTWDGTKYTGISGLVQSGRNGGAWDGATGIISATARDDANKKLYSIGVVKVADLHQGMADSDTTTFAGQTVNGSDTIAMFTYGGDANLDGKINIDDYGLIDSHVGQSGTAFGWHNGDFNYDGKINIDDYGIIDGNIGAQGAPIPTVALTSGGVMLQGVSAVPEPASFGLIALMGAGLLRRRRQH